MLPCGAPPRGHLGESWGSRQGGTDAVKEAEAGGRREGRGKEEGREGKGKEEGREGR